MHTLSLAPDGSLRLGLPTGRSLDFKPCVEALRLIEKLLLAEHNPAAGYEDKYPTQHIVDKWLKGYSVVRPDTTKLPPAPKVKKVKPAKILGGVDLSKLEFEL